MDNKEVENGYVKSILITSLIHKQNKKKIPSLEMTYAFKYNEKKKHPCLYMKQY